MSALAWFAVLLGAPLLGAGMLALIPGERWAARVNVAASFIGFAASLRLAAIVLAHGRIVTPGEWFFLDSFNVFLVALTAFVSTTTAIFSGPYMRHELARGRVDARRLRLYHAMFQLFVFGMFLGQTSNNMAIIWLSLEVATLATVLLVSLYRTQAAIAAAWKYLILCGVGISLALFGTVLLFFTSSEALGHGEAALTWTRLAAASGQLDPVVMKLAFVFLLIGYGTKVGLAPMHAWLPDAHAEGPTPVSAVLSGLLLNLALYALVRCKMLVDAAAGADFAGRLMMGFGLAALLVAAFSLHRQTDIKRMFSFSSIEHMGLMTFAFGIGTPLAGFAALLHMTTHSLVKSGIFFTVGHAAQNMGTQAMARIRGLIAHQPGIGWGLLIGACAIAGFPPFGVFTSEFLVFSAALHAAPWTTAVLLAGLLVATAGLFRFVPHMSYGEPPVDAVVVRANMLPVWLHLALALALGVSVPGFLAHWYEQAAHIIAGGGA